jgi:hypothetical protein
MRSILHLPRIQNFDWAERTYNNIKPIRGTEVRPLGQRRDHKRYAIVKRSDTQYVCTLHRHPVISYTKKTHPGEGTLIEVSLCEFDTRTTRKFISHVLGVDCYSFNKKTYIELGKRSSEVDGKWKVTGAYYLPPKHTLQIRHEQVLNPVPVKKKVLDREVTKELREKYKEEMADAEAMLRLGMARYSSGDGMSDGGYDPRKKISEYGREFLDDLTREEMTEYLWLTASDLGQRRVQVQKWAYNVQTQKHEPEGKLRPATRYYIVAALYHVAHWGGLDIHKEVELPVGQRA